MLAVHTTKETAPFVVTKGKQRIPGRIFAQLQQLSVLAEEGSAAARDTAAQPHGYPRFLPYVPTLLEKKPLYIKTICFCKY